MCKLYSGSTKRSKALETRWETKDLGQSAASGQAHVSHRTRKIGNIRKKNRQPISELLERKIGNFRSRLGSCLPLFLPPFLPCDVTYAISEPRPSAILSHGGQRSRVTIVRAGGLGTRLGRDLIIEEKMRPRTSQWCFT